MRVEKGDSGRINLVRPDSKKILTALLFAIGSFVIGWSEIDFKYRPRLESAYRKCFFNFFDFLPFPVTDLPALLVI